MRPICVIPARIGSKRLPRKNVLPLGGRPMLGWTVSAAAESGVFDRVLVSTEDEAVAEIARGEGAEVPFLRPAELAGDTVTNVAVCLHVVERLDAGEDDAVVCLQPSSPLRDGTHVRAAWRAFHETGADFLVSVTAIDPHYFHWALREDGGAWGMVFGDKYQTVRQDLPPVFRPNGAIKIARVSALRRQGNFFGPRLGVHDMPEPASIHVATAFDLALAETVIARGLSA